MRDREPFSPRQKEIIRMVAKGMSNKEIADELVLSPKTIKNHVTLCHTKLGSTNRVELANAARARGLLGPL